MSEDIRWVQRFANYSKALKRLTDALDLAKTRPLSDLEKQGVIQSFEFTHEMAWLTIKDFYENQGESGIQGSRDAARLAFQRGLIQNGEAWMDMIISRNRTSHTYAESVAEEIYTKISGFYATEFMQLEETLRELAEKE